LKEIKEKYENDPNFSFENKIKFKKMQLEKEA
jgi:hypothetical protein